MESQSRKYLVPESPITSNCNPLIPLGVSYLTGILKKLWFESIRLIDPDQVTQTMHSAGVCPEITLVTNLLLTLVTLELIFTARRTTAGFRFPIFPRLAR